MRPDAMTPPEFAEACRTIVARHLGDAAHRQLDALVTELLTGLGYGEGMGIFINRVRPYHADLIDSVESFLKKTGMSASAFGRKALGDPRFLSDVKSGRRPGFVTLRRVEMFLRDSENDIPK